MTSTKVRVYGYHLDMYGHVNNARYLEFFETARWEFIEDKISFRELEKLNIAFVVANISINYRRPALMGQILNIKTAMSHISKKSAKIHQEIYIEGTDELIADAAITFVIINSKTGKVTPITGKTRNLLNLFSD
jgi:thioesterase-3